MLDISQAQDAIKESEILIASMAHGKGAVRLTLSTVIWANSIHHEDEAMTKYRVLYKDKSVDMMDVFYGTGLAAAVECYNQFADKLEK